MINEQYEERESEENSDHEGSLINQNSLNGSPSKDLSTSTVGEQETGSDLNNESVNDGNLLQGPRYILDLFTIKTDVREVRDIVQILLKTVFQAIENNFDQLTNRSSNTFGMRVKDSLILKIQTKNKKEIPFAGLKTSMLCRLIDDDDQRIQFSTYIVSPASSSNSETLSTKQKKFVSLAEDVKIFNRLETECIFENKVGFSNELTDASNDRLTDNDEKLHDFTSQKSSISPVKGESLFFNERNLVRSAEENASFDQNQKIHMHITKCKDFSSHEPPICSEDLNIIQEAQMSDHSTRDMVQSIQNLSTAQSTDKNQIIVSSADATTYQSLSRMETNSVSRNGNTKEEETVEVSKYLNKCDHQKLKYEYENICTGLIKHGKEIIREQLETVDENTDKSSVYPEEQIEQMDLTVLTERPVISNFDTEIKIREEQSMEQSVTISESKLSDMSHDSNNHKPNDGFDEYSRAIIDLNLNQSNFESNNEDITPQRERLSVNFSIEKSRNDDGTTFTSDARFSLKRSPGVDEINDREISEVEGCSESLNFNEKNNGDIQSTNSNTEDYKKSKLSYTIAVEKEQRTERNILMTNEIDHSSFENRGTKYEAVEATEHQKTISNSEKKSSLFLENEAENTIASEETTINDYTIIERKHSKSFKIRDQFSTSFQSSSIRATSEIDLEGTAQALLRFEAQKRAELTVSDEKLKIKSSFDEETRSLINSLALSKTSSKFSLTAGKFLLSCSLEQILSEDSWNAGKTSGKSSRTDIGRIISPRSNNPVAETLLISSKDRDASNQIDTLYGVDENPNENELKIGNNEIEIKINRSRWSLPREKSFTKVKPDKQEISRKEDLTNDTEDFANEPMTRKKSILNVVSKFSTEGHGWNGDNLQSGNYYDIADDESSQSVLNSETNELRNKSENSLIVSRLCGASVNSLRNVDSGPQKNPSSTYGITGLSSSLDKSQNLSERTSCIINESDMKSIQNELKLVPTSSEDLDSKAVQSEKSYSSVEVNKPCGRLLQKMPSRNFGEEISKECLKSDNFPENIDPKNASKKELSKEIKTVGKIVAISGENFSRKSELIISNKISETIGRRNQMENQNIKPVFGEKSETVGITYVVRPAVQDQPEGQIIIENQEQSESTLIKKETNKEQSHDLLRQSKEKHSLLSNIKSMFKSSNKSEPVKRSIPIIPDPENRKVVNESFHSFKTYSSSTSASEAEVAQEQSIDFQQENVKISMIQSMKSLQDNRKRMTNGRKPGHKLFDGEDTPVVNDNMVQESCQTTAYSDFIRRQNEDVTVNDKINNSEELIANSYSLIEQEQVDKKTTKVSDHIPKSKKKQNLETNTKKFAISFSRIFSNSFRSRNGGQESRAVPDSQSNSEDHFEIKIPLSTSDYNNIQGNDSSDKIRKQRSDVPEYNRDEPVAIKSLDSMYDLDSRDTNKVLIAKHSSRALESKYEQNGTLIFSAPIEVNQIPSENELEKTDLSNNVQEMTKLSQNIYVGRGTPVSYAPIVESAKCISNECDDQSDEDDQPEEHHKRSTGKSFAIIRNLFSRASMKSRQAHITVEDQMNHEVKKQSRKSGKTSIIKHQMDTSYSVDQLDDEAKGGAMASIRITFTKHNKYENKERANSPEIQEQQSRSQEKIRQGEIINDIEGTVDHDVVLHVNNVAMSRCDFLANRQNHKNCFDDLKNLETMKSEKTNTLANRVESNHDSLESSEIVERIVKDEIAFPALRQTDLSDIADVKQKTSQRSSDTREESLSSMATSYMNRRIEIVEEGLRGVNRHDEDFITLSMEDSQKTPKGRIVAKTESVFLRGLKRLFRKRSSVVDSIASNNNAEEPANDLCQSLNIQTLSHLLKNDGADAMTKTKSCASRKSNRKETHDDIQFVVHHTNSETMKHRASYGERSHKLDDENVLECLNDLETESTNHETEIDPSVALTISGIHISTSFSRQDDDHGSETPMNHDKNAAQNRSKIGSRKFELNPSFVSRRPTIVMMATPDPPRKQPQTEASTSSDHLPDGSSNSPTAFYYLLGPSLDEALIDVRVVFQNLIDKITGKDT